MIKLSCALLICSCLCSFLPPPAGAQCADQTCRNLQAVFDSAMIDFREYRSASLPIPNLSTSLAKVTCQVNTWANNVPMYACYAQLPLAAGDSWFRTIMETAKRLQSSWTFKVDSRGDNRYVEAGPENCEVTPTEGPYIGQCPFHAQMVRQADAASLYLWINSYSSPYLLHHAPAPPKPAHAAVPACDDFCQNFKRAFEARLNAFANLGATQAGEELAPEASVAFPGARRCSITRTARAAADDPNRKDEGTRFACFWLESSASAAETRFRDLVSRVRPLVPPEWAAQQQNESEAATGANVTVWFAAEPGSRHQVSVYLSGVSVALHITTWAPPTQ